MIDTLIHWSLKNRFVVLGLTLLLAIWGIWQTFQMPIDVLPDLSAPSVNVVVEAHGMAPEEVETRVVQPIETQLTSVSGVRQVRSTTTIGNAVIDVEFDWDTDIYLARQLVSEGLQAVGPQLPDEVDPPIMGPIASVMGEIMFIGLTADDRDPLELRSEADWLVSQRINALPGIAQATPIGGNIKQYQVIADPHRLADHGIALDQLHDALSASNTNISAGFHRDGGQEYLIYGLGRIDDPKHLNDIVVDRRDALALTVGDLATVEIGPALARGAAAVNGEPGVIIAIQKQPDTNTLELTRDLENVLDDIETSLPEDVELHRNLLRQVDFIDVAVANVLNALRNGSLLVILIIFAFLAALRPTAIAVTVIPLSLIVAAIALDLTGGTINTMTLGGMAIAVGVLVDDAIVVVENASRRLHLNAQRQTPEDPLRVIRNATREVVSPLYYANLVVFLIFLPLLFLTGFEGRLLEPLGIAFIIAVLASLLIALTVTPAMCAVLMGRQDWAKSRGDSPLVRLLKRIYRPVLDATLDRWAILAAGSTLLVLLAAGSLTLAGQSFLPDFNEGALTINVNTLPGTSLETSNELGQWVTDILHDHPEVQTTGRRTGRADHDEHAQGVHASEIDVTLDLDAHSRDRQAFMADLRDDLSDVPGVNITIDQPISHRIDHMLTGVDSQVALKIVGDELQELRRLGAEFESTLAGVDGVVDLSLEQQTDIPFLLIDMDYPAIADHGLHVDDVAKTLEMAFVGRSAGQILEGQRSFDIALRYPPALADDLEAIRHTQITTTDGDLVPLHALADIRRDRRPNPISREDARRQITLSFNIVGGDLVGTVEEARQALDDQVAIPEGYFFSFGGQVEQAGDATRILFLLSLVAILGILLSLVLALRSAGDAFLVLLNLPLALIGGVAGIFWLDGILSVASLVGFITLFGIATRNGLLLITHIRHLYHHEGITDHRQATIQGSLERLSPILMTALASGLGLLPLALESGQPGGEIQGPMAVVILFGLISSTVLTLLILPALYLRFGDLSSTDPPR